MDFTPVMEQCAPQVAAVTLRAIIAVESGHNPLALNVNGAWKLGRQPRDLSEARAWLHWLMARGHSVDVGLTQVNTMHFTRFGLTPDNAFDPCRNLAAGASVLHEAYQAMRARQPDPQVALRQAVSAYNTGSPERGFRNGYVARVETAVRRRGPLPLSQEQHNGRIDNRTER
ncbi:MAG: lytic transglycosylase domain-containing protein [Burkholderiales bacterium]|nr:lytic transglycosylase domain-containing protein [Burkholderiales bacterium]